RSRPSASPLLDLAIALRTSVAKSSSLISVRETPTMTSRRGSFPPCASVARAGYSFRWARSPVAPNTTSAAETATDSLLALVMCCCSRAGSRGFFARERPQGGDDTGVEARTVPIDEQLPMTLAHLHWDMQVGS